MIEYGIDVVDRLDYEMNAVPMRNAPTGGFLDQLQDQSEVGGGLDGISFQMELAIRNQNRNRGNYRCSKVRNRYFRGYILHVKSLTD